VKYLQPCCASRRVYSSLYLHASQNAAHGAADLMPLTGRMDAAGNWLISNDFAAMLVTV
jgi:hypothetical protein